MRIAIHWLQQFFATPLPQDAQLVESLCESGTETVLMPHDHPDTLWHDHVIVAEITHAEPHPNADSLRVCRVNNGSEEKIIVCGAPNARAGIRVALAPVGSLLPGDFVIKKSKIRGVESQGMMCSVRELRLGEDHDGIIELESEPPLGSLVADHLERRNAIIECEITANRGDCFSALGVARELAAKHNLALINAHVPSLPQPDMTGKIAVTVKAPAACPLYMAASISNINIQASTPQWMSRALIASGVALHNIVVDITNYVMLEFGHPLHAFSAERIEGAIQVRFAKEQETITLLNHKTVTLNPSTLLIADDAKPLALAGIMGSLDSGCHDGTTHMILESALFMPEALASQARSYGLHTDASMRFERGVDPQGVGRAMNRAISLLVEHAHGTLGAITHAHSASGMPKPQSVAIDVDYINALLGTALSESEIRDTLTKLGFVCEQKEDALNAIVPSYRWDVHAIEDLAEEVGRLYGLNAIAAQTLRLPVDLATNAHDENYKLHNQISDFVSHEFYETINYSFLEAELTAPFHTSEPIVLQNPIADNQAAMRTHILPSLLKNIHLNRARGFHNELRLFETAMVYRGTLDTLMQPNMAAGIIAKGTLHDWQETSTCDFFWLKRYVSTLLSSLGMRSGHWIKAQQSYWHPGQSASIQLGKTVIGSVGALHPEIAIKFDINEPVVAFELSLDELEVAVQKQKTTRYKPIAHTPRSARDFAFIVPSHVDFATLQSSIKKSAGKHMRAITLFDIYTGAPLAQGETSLAVRVEWQNPTMTLTEADITNWADAIVAAAADLGARLRDG